MSKFDINMHPYTIIGIAEIIKREVLQQIDGQLTANIVKTERTVVV
jgi:hypothetical protein